MKKTIALAIILAVFTTVFSATCSHAYSSEEFSLDLPDTYEIYSEDETCTEFSNENSDSIIIVKSHMSDDDVSYPYTEVFLNKLAAEAPDELKKLFLNELKQTLGDTLPEDCIVVEVTNKEVTDFTVNNYKCLFLSFTVTIDASKLYDTNENVDDFVLYRDTYVSMSGKDMFGLTIQSYNKDYVKSEEINKVIDSFEIKNYKEPSRISSGASIRIVIVIAGVIIAAIVGIIINIKNRKKKKVLVSGSGTQPNEQYPNTIDPNSQNPYNQNPYNQNQYNQNQYNQNPYNQNPED